MTKENAHIVIKRNQNGEHEKHEYTGSLKTVNDALYVTFTETDETGASCSHLLKITCDGMEWTKTGHTKTKSGFKKGEIRPFLFATPHGSIPMTLHTHDYSYTKKDTHHICVSYSIDQGCCHISDYETEIIITA